VAALLDLVEVCEAGIDPLDPAARRGEHLAGERRVADRDLDGRGAWPDARNAARNRPASQYHRAADAPVPVSQLTVMLSRMLSRVRLPVGLPSTNAREIL
jgi:hypothetical protein